MTPPAGYTQLLLVDDFDTLDTTRWHITLPIEHRTYGQGQWDAACVAIESGNLVLSAHANLHCGEVRGLIDFPLPFYCQWRARWPDGGPGGWPALWTLARSGSAQEVDVCECDSAQPHRIGQNLHWAAGGVNNGGYTDQAVDYTADYHLYGALVSPQGIDFYIDDYLVRRFGQPSPAVIFDPQYLIIGLAIFGSGQPTHLPPDGTTQWPLRLLVDRVEVWGPGFPPIDTTAPTITIMAPLDRVPRHTTQVVSAEIADASGVASATLFVNGQSKGTRFAPPWSWSWNVPAKPGVTYLLAISAQDGYGNTASRVMNVAAI